MTQPDNEDEIVEIITPAAKKAQDDARAEAKAEAKADAKANGVATLELPRAEAGAKPPMKKVRFEDPISDISQRYNLDEVKMRSIYDDLTNGISLSDDNKRYLNYQISSNPNFRDELQRYSTKAENTVATNSGQGDALLPLFEDVDQNEKRRAFEGGRIQEQKEKSLFDDPKKLALIALGVCVACIILASTGGLPLVGLLGISPEFFIIGAVATGIVAVGSFAYSMSKGDKNSRIFPELQNDIGLDVPSAEVQGLQNQQQVENGLKKTSPQSFDDLMKMIANEVGIGKVSDAELNFKKNLSPEDIDLLNKIQNTNSGDTVPGGRVSSTFDKKSLEKNSQKLEELVTSKNSISSNVSLDDVKSPNLSKERAKTTDDLSSHPEATISSPLGGKSWVQFTARDNIKGGTREIY